MDINVLNQELSEKIDELQAELNSLQTELNTCVNQRDVLFIIERLQSFVKTNQGYQDVMATRDISREAFYTFISLLDSSEYIRGFRNTRGGSSTRLETKQYDQYFLTLGPGIGISVNFCETEIKEHERSSTKDDLTVRAYVDTQDLRVETISEPVYPEHPVVLIRKQDGGRVFDTNTTDESVTFDGQKLNEVLIPISPDDLANRFVNMIKSPEEMGMRQ